MNFCFGQNTTRILPDSTHKYAQIEMSRAHAATYQLTFQNEKRKKLYQKKIQIDSIPQIIKVPWENYDNGIYFMVLKSKKEELQLMLMKE